MCLSARSDCSCAGLVRVGGAKGGGNPTNTRITTFVNLTPHAISVILASGETLTIDPQPTPARVSQSHTVITSSDDGDQSGRSVEIAAPVYGEIVELLVENGTAVQYGEPLFRVKTA